jgi:Sap, sulfolipid-1-addressing protein
MFVPGMILGFPGVYYLAALKAIAQGHPNWSGRIAFMIAFSVVAFVLVWVPLVRFLIAPAKTRRSVAAANAWLVAHLIEIGSVVSAGVGVDEIMRGARAISSRRSVPLRRSDDGWRRCQRRPRLLCPHDPAV